MNPKVEDAIKKIYANSVKNPPITLDGHIKNENGITNDYRGRAIYEFFQNAIDRAESKIWIYLDSSSHTLTIANDGTEFSINKNDRNYSDLESLCSINTSSKNQNQSIGNKGVGFKSCWEYTQRVSVCSIYENTPWGFEFYNPLTIEKIDTTIGNELIECWKSDNEFSVVFKNNDNRVPSFYFPLPILNAESYFETFNGAKTVITFHNVTPEKIEDLKTKIKEFSEHQIFFVQQLDKLKKANVELILQVDNIPEKTLNTQINLEEWLIVSKEFKDGELSELQRLSGELNYKIENPKIAIAFPLKQEMKEESDNFHSNFYCYLPTVVKCGFNVLMHGDFLLDVSRKQIDFSNNPYNARLLNHLAELFVDSLLKKTELHSLPYFAKFLLPTNKEGKTESVFKESLIKSANLTSILRKVYTSDRSWGIDSYSHIFNVIDRWKRDPNYNENRDKYFECVYSETIRYFCDSAVYIVPILEGDIIIDRDNLPGKESNKRLFFRQNEESTIDNSVLKELKNISLTNFPAINREYYFKSVVKRYSTIEILRAINIDKEINRNEYYPKILKFVYSLIKNEPIRSDKKFFFLDDNSTELQLSRINLPCTDGQWHRATRCYVDILPEISVEFNRNELFELDLAEYSKLIGGENTNLEEIGVGIKKFGVWQSILPLLYENKEFKLPFVNIPKLENNHLKFLLNNSIKDWQNLVSKDKLFKAIKSESWFFDGPNKLFASPSEVFLFNDARARRCISQEIKSPELTELYRLLNIESIEETQDSEKIVSQLKKMKNFEVDETVDETHKTVYKQLVLKLSRIKGNKIEDIPLLSTKSIYINEHCLFTQFEYRKYVHHFSNYNFVNFDVNTAVDFIKNLTLVSRFEPNFSIKPDLDQLEKDLEIKSYFEHEYLTDFFALAESFLPSANFDKVEAIRRWNKLEIFKAPNVWMEVIFNDEIKKLYEDENKDVLYRPSSESDKESVGLLVHDLVNYDKNPNLSKFGIEIAEAVFRNQNFGEILSNYIQKKQNNSRVALDFLNERGIGDSELNQNKKFIDCELVVGKEKEDFVQVLSKIVGIYVNPNNWTEKNMYKGHSFLKLKEIVIQDLQQSINNVGRFESLLELINPYEGNLKFINERKRYLQICYYAYNNQELTNEMFDRIMLDKSNLEVLFSFEFGLNHCFLIFEIPLTMDLNALEIAECILNIIDIKRDCGLPENMELKPMVSDGIKVQPISANGKEDVYTVKRTLKYHEELRRSQHKRGIGMEKILSLHYAKLLFQKNQHEFVKDIIHQIDDLKDLEIPDEIKDIQTLAEILQVSAKKGDGLGYDVLEPVFENDKLKEFNLVEVKSSQDNISIHLSENERERVLNFAQKDNKNWRLYHFVNGQNYDRTEIALNAVKNHAESYKGDHLLVGVDWMINFQN